MILSVLKSQIKSSSEGGDNGGGSLNSASIAQLACKPSSILRSPSTACICPLLGAGWTFFWLLVLDIAVSSFLSPLWLLVRTRVYKALASRFSWSDYDTKAEFDVAEEFVGTLYRLFLILQGAAVFPTVTLIGALSFFPLKFFSDRLKLIVLCKKMLQREEPVKLQLLLGCAIVTCLAVLFIYPQGLLFVAIQYPGYDDCSFSKP